MRALSLAVGLAAAAFGVNLAEMQRGADFTDGPPVGRGGPGGKKQRMSFEHYRKHDPFHGIPSKGRRGAASRMRLQMRAHDEGRTAVGQRNAPCRGVDRNHRGIPFHSNKRNNAFLAALSAGESRNMAMKLARRVPA